MNIDSLISAAPGLLDNLKGLGLDDNNISGLAGEIGNQLGGGDGFDFTDLLTTLQADNFLEQLNVQDIAQKLDISPDITEKAVGFIAPIVADFGGAQKGILGKLAGSLFGKK